MLCYFILLIYLFLNQQTVSTQVILQQTRITNKQWKKTDNNIIIVIIITTIIKVNIAKTYIYIYIYIKKKDKEIYAECILFSA